MNECVIEDIPPLDHQAPLHLAAIAALEAYYGGSVDLAYLSGVSGEAWRFLCSGPGPDVDAPFAETAATMLQGLDALGIDRCYLREMTREGALALIHHEIDAGRPVLAVGTEGWGDWGIVAGYVGDEELLCRNAVARTGEYQTVNSAELAFRGPASCEMVTLGAHGAPPSRRELVAGALAEAVLWFASVRRAGLLTGRAAYEQWIAAFANMDLELGYPATLGILTWARSKTLAADFVQQVAHSSSSADLAAAAEQYDIVSRNWDALRGLFGIDQERNLRDPARRREGANILRDALTAETKAIGRIKEALYDDSDRLADRME